MLATDVRLFYNLKTRLGIITTYSAAIDSAIAIKDVNNNPIAPLYEMRATAQLYINNAYVVGFLQVTSDGYLRIRNQGGQEISALNVRGQIEFCF